MFENVLVCSIAGGSDENGQSPVPLLATHQGRMAERSSHPAICQEEGRGLGKLPEFRLCNLARILLPFVAVRTAQAVSAVNGPGHATFDVEIEDLGRDSDARPKSAGAYCERT